MRWQERFCLIILRDVILSAVSFGIVAALIFPKFHEERPSLLGSNGGKADLGAGEIMAAFVAVR